MFIELTNQKDNKFLINTKEIIKVEQINGGYSNCCVYYCTVNGNDSYMSVKETYEQIKELLGYK